jgi:large subunit ribosomal protein L3
MQKGILGKKLGMTQVFGEDGRVTPVTVVEAGPCVVVQRKTEATDGYNAIQVGFGDIKEQRVNKPLKGHFAKAGVKPVRFVRELRLSNIDGINVGDTLKADLFAEGELVDVTGTSKGKGFAGSIKRHGFGRGPESHGSKYHRRTGSLGTGGRMSGGGGRVFKGRKMPGRMGGDKVTVQALRVVRVDAERNLLLIKGAIPGPKGALVTIKSSVKAR